MFTQNDFDVMRLKYQEWNAQFSGPNMSEQGRQPGSIRQLLTALRGSRDPRTPQSTNHGKAPPASTDRVAK